MLHFSPEDVRRFMSLVDVLPGVLTLPSGRESTACWLWMGCRSRGRGNRKWYGSFRLGKSVLRAHRFSSEALGGQECPPGHHRDHECCNSLCVNPDHIEVVTRAVNQERKNERRSFRQLNFDPITGVRVKGEPP